MDTAKPMQDSTPLLACNGVDVVIDGNRLVDNVSLCAQPGELVGLIGPNGAGKSTLLATLAGLVKPHKGEVVLAGRPLASYAANERAQTIGWLEQLAASHWPVSVEHLVSLGRLPYLSAWQNLTDDDHHDIESAMKATDCYSLRNRQVSNLSGGELTRVMLARVLAANPQVVLADEPVSALDIGHQLQTMELLKSLVGNGRTCVVVLHDLLLAQRYCDRLYLMNESRLVAHGVANTVLTPETLQAVYGVAIVAEPGQTPYFVASGNSKQ